MWMLLYCKDNISRDHIWNLFSFSFKNNLISIFHPFLNNYVKLSYIIYNFSASAVRAVSFIHITSATAFITLDLHLHLHSKTHLNFLIHDTLAMALATLLSLAIFSSASSALRTIYISCN